MEDKVVIILAVVAFLIILLANTMLQVQENQRVVVLRFGKFEKILNPGLNFIVPYTDVSVVVDLTKHLPEWQSMKLEEINDAIKMLVLNNPDPNKYK